MRKIAKRLQGITASPTMAVMQEAQRLKKQGIDVIDLGPGEPDFPTPEMVKQAAAEAIAQNFTKYTAAAGIQELRQAVADKYNREWDTDFGVEHVIITNGAKHAIYNVCMTLFEEGDEVLLPAPYWVTFPEAIKIAGATPIEMITPEDTGFVFGADAVEEAIGPRTRGIVVNTPNNPTGAVLPRQTVEKLAELGRSGGLFSIFDETYDYFTYGGETHVSLASFVKPSEDFFALIGAVSKTYSMTGWRIGFCVAHRQIISKMAEFQSHATGNPASISQRAALAALRSEPASVKEMKEEYGRRRSLVLKALAEIPGFSCAPPNGAFYVFPNVMKCMDALGINDSTEFSKFLIQEARVATVPGSAFGMEGYIRISYATSMENLREAFARIKSSVATRVEKAKV